MIKEKINKLFLKHKKFLKFGTVGAIGTVVNTVILWWLATFIGMYYLVAAVIATEIAIICNFIGNHVFTFSDNKDPSPLYTKFAKFQFISLTTIFGTVALLWIFISIFGLKYLLVWNFVSILLIFLVNFELNRKFTWKEKSSKNFLVLFGILFFVGFVSAGNGTLNFYSDPLGASVFVDDVDYGITSKENVSFVAGNYSVVLVLTGYENLTDDVEVFENVAFDFNVSLVEVVANSTVYDFPIIANSTSIVWDNGSYSMHETDVANFSVTLNSSGEVEWFVNDSLFSVTNGTVHDFSWYPGVLGASSDVVPWTVKAKSADDEFSWDVDVLDTLNPFFSENNGTAGATIYVYSKDLLDGFDDIENLSVVISSKDNGVGVTKSYDLVAEDIGDETKWSFFIGDEDFFGGVNFLSGIVLYFANDTESFLVPVNGSNVRAFIKDVVASSGGGSSGGGGGGSGKIEDEVEFIYVVLDKNVLGQNETQVISLDAKAKYGITSVGIILKDSFGIYFGEKLEIVSGAKNYGTWSVNLSSLAPGSYELVYIDLIGYDKGSYVREKIEGRSFYVVSSEVVSSEKLEIVYSVLGESVVGVAGNVSFKLDARDFDGIEEVSAFVTKSREEIIESFEVPLYLVSGDAKYGTWEGFIFVDEPDVTFKVVSVGLSDGEGFREHEIEERSLYANSLVENLRGSDGNSFNFFTGLSVSNLEELRDGPRALAIMGFSFFAFIAVFYFLFYKIQERKILKGE